MNLQCGERSGTVGGSGRVKKLVRTLLLQRIYSKDDTERLYKDAETFHRWALDWEFEKYGPFGFCRLPHGRFTATFSYSNLVIPPPSPERPLGGLLFPVPNDFRVMFVRPWPDYPEDYPEHKIPEVRVVQMKKHSRGTTIFIGDDETTSYDKEDCQLFPSSVQARTHRRSRVVALFHPYRSRTVAPSRSLQKSDETDCFSSINEPISQKSL